MIIPLKIKHCSYMSKTLKCRKPGRILSRGTLPPKQTVDGFYAGESVPVNEECQRYAEDYCRTQVRTQADIFYRLESQKTSDKKQTTKQAIK